MTWLTIQPTFSIEVPGTPDETVRRMRVALRRPELAGFARPAGVCFEFKIAPEDQRFWSPHLSVQVYPVASHDQPADGSVSTERSELYGRFTPRPEIWTMFMAIYLIVATLGLGAAILAYVQWTMGTAPWGLLVSTAAVLVISLLHVISRIGQSWSIDQMRLLRDRLDTTVRVAIDPQPNVDAGPLPAIAGVLGDAPGGVR